MSRTKVTTAQWNIRDFQSERDFTEEWNRVDLLALPHRPNARYMTGFANSERCIEAALRLRYEVFNLELEEGLDSSIVTGLDRDDYDDQMTHLVLIERATGEVVGTYRMQTVRHALETRGVYSAQEFDIAPLEPFAERLTELGRACLALDHRTFRAMIGMWLGLGAFMNVYGQHYLFGCCSLTTQDPDDGWRALKTARRGNHIHESLWLAAKPECSCGGASKEHDPAIGDAISLPKLFRTYLRLGSKVISEPAIDREFGTVDFLVMIDAREIALSALEVVK